MTKIIRISLLLLLGLSLLPGAASCPDKTNNHNTSRGTPQGTLETFRQALKKTDYHTAFNCLSENTRTRYPKQQFQMMLELTIFGVLLKNLLINWKVVNTTCHGDKAIVILQHLKYPDYQKDLLFVYEEEGWRVDITMAQLLGVPQEDEDNLFAYPHKSKPKEEKE